MTQSKDFIPQLGILFFEAFVLFTQLVQNFLLLSLHRLERFHLVLKLLMFVFPLLMQLSYHLLLFLDDRLQRVNLVRVVCFVVLKIVCLCFRLAVVCAE
jgi:hypothetical protein